MPTQLTARTFQPTFSGAFIAHMEPSVEDEAQKNQLCTVIPMPDQPVHWLNMLAVNMANQYRWSRDKALRLWLEQSRLDPFTGMAHRVSPEQTDRVALLQRYAAGAGAAAANLPRLPAQAA
jgi:hypothetical protein